MRRSITVRNPLTVIGDWAANAVAGIPPWTNAVGLARSLAALCTLSTLLLNSSTTLIRTTANGFACDGLRRFGLFCVVGPAHLELGRFLLVFLLGLVVIGWRPRWTAIPHWYAAMSFLTSVQLIDGGDQVAVVISLLLIPVALTDPRHWHWESPPASSPLWHLVVAWAALLAIRVQAAGVYFHAAVGKLKVEEWVDGTAVYYWFTDPNVGMADWMRPFLLPLLHTGTGVSLLTWGSLLIEFLLFTGLTMDRRLRKPLLVVGITFHGLISLVHGLVSFGFAMWALLVLYLWPVEEPVAFEAIGKWLRRMQRQRVGSNVALPVSTSVGASDG
jgi:antimicrobial peptide system SdpB family protein